MMPKGYVIVTENVTNQDGMTAYSKKAVPTIFAAGGTIVIAGPPDAVLEGSWHGTQTVVLEFPSVEAAHTWYNSADYQAAIELRRDAVETNFVIMPGFERPSA